MAHICKDVFPPVSASTAADAAVDETKENKPAIELGTSVGNTNLDFRHSLVLVTGKKWQTGRTLRVAFMGGDGRVIDRMKPYITEWSKHANIKFAFTDDPDAEIRIAFDKSGGSWSYMGTDSLTIKSGPTMNFGWLDPNTAENEYSRVVLHEVGHALGCPHEHQHPKNGIPWDKEAVYKHYMGPPNNWTRAEIDHNLFAKYSETITQFSEFDKKSIMLYAIPNELTIGDYYVGWNRTLSDMDKAFIKDQYPSPTAPPPPKAIETISYGRLGDKAAPLTKEYKVTKYGRPFFHASPPK